VAGRTQFANDLFAAELAVRTGLAVSCVYPGLVATGVFRNARGVPRPVRLTLAAVQRRLGAKPADAAATPVELATAPGVASGFYGPRCRPIPVPGRVSAHRRAALWAASEDLVGPWLDAAEVGG
jgi:NAD(P)-dependent dehydrogenase (short-subunit alcohol dehydrogenase family)